MGVALKLKLEEIITGGIILEKYPAIIIVINMKLKVLIIIIGVYLPEFKRHKSKKAYEKL